MAVQTDSQLQAAAVVVRDEITPLANTATRVGGLMENIATNKINIDKISTSISADTGSTTKLPTVAATEAAILSGRTVITVKKTLTSAEILALFTTPITVIPAAGAGTVIMPLRIMTRLNYNTTTYTTNTNLILGLSTIFQVTLTGAIGVSSTTLSTYTPATAAGSTTPANSTNVPITISAQTGNPLAGDSTLDLYISYTVITL